MRVAGRWRRAGSGLALAGCAVLTSCSSGSPSPPAAPATGLPSSAPAVSTTTSAVPSGDPLAAYYAQRASWKGCGRDHPGFQCTTVRVPLDYADPGKGEITLALTRQRATSSRLGTLFANPGGPGVSGVDFGYDASGAVSAAVRKRYDLVWFDPRGVGHSTPVDCLTDAQLDRFLAADDTPDTQAEAANALAEARTFAQGCEQRSGRLLPYLGTTSVARDLDVLRAVVGDQQLHYLGFSYGTSIGATYARLFPQRVARLVLDGALDPTASAGTISLAQAVGFEANLHAFATDCAGRGDCPFPGDATQLVAGVQRLLLDADAHPLRSQSGRQVTESLALTGVLMALYDQGTWDLLRQGLADARRGDGTTLLLLADYYDDREASGHYASNEMEATPAVDCLDHPEPAPDLTAYERQAAQWAQRAPLFGAPAAWSGLLCASWPVKPVPQRPLTGVPDRPVLVVGTTNDPATPYAWAGALTRYLRNAVLLTRVGNGHTAYDANATDPAHVCIRRAVDTYLLSGRTPAAGTRCA